MQYMTMATFNTGNARIKYVLLTDGMVFNNTELGGALFIASSADDYLQQNQQVVKALQRRIEQAGGEVISMFGARLTIRVQVADSWESVFDVIRHWAIEAFRPAKDVVKVDFPGIFR